MFGTGISWGIPVPPMTLMVTVGSIGVRAAEPDALVLREVLCLTLSLDHTVVDGGSAARFAADLRTVIEQATVLPATCPDPDYPTSILPSTADPADRRGGGFA
jgi:pyruvate/2-oxoglutarate dehydrogenase complex dihydrolipoamide acyltransferase (E2) component